jgi:hypothetical protein
VRPTPGSITEVLVTQSPYPGEDTVYSDIEQRFLSLGAVVEAADEGAVIELLPGR